MPSGPSPGISEGWREAWRLSEPAYTELAFQAIYAVRQGNLPPGLPAAEVARRARRRVRQSKLLVSGLLAFFSLGPLLLVDPAVVHLFVLPYGLYLATGLGAVVVLDMILLWWTGLQVLPSFLASGVVPLLRSLPVAPRLLRRTALLLLVRLFDAPAATCLVLTPLVAGYALRSPLAGLLLVPAVLVGILFAVALALVSGRFFVRHVQGARGGGLRTWLRWSYLVLWAVPAFAMYGFVAVGPAFLRFVAALALQGPTGLLDAVFLAFPFSLTALPSLGLGLSTTGAGAALDPLVIAAGTLGYTGLAVLVGLWLRAAPLRLTLEAPHAPSRGSGASVRIATTSVARAIVRKDLRVASRTPGFAFLVLLPLLESAALGLWTFVAGPGSSNVLGLANAAVESAALLATFFGPAFFAIEVMGYSYTRTLPLPGRSVLEGKVGLVLGVYSIAALLVVALTLPRVFQPGLFLGFVVAELPAVAAAALLEYSVLLERARSKGLPVTSLYAGAWWAAAVSVPGLLESGTPLALFAGLQRGATAPFALPAMALLAVVELALVLPFALAATRGESR